MKYKRLYIIGNGFDLHHGIKSGYSEFRDFLKESPDKFTALNIIGDYYNGCDDEFWSDFENNLSKFDVVKYIEEKTIEYYPDLSDENFAREVEDASFNTEKDFENLSLEIKNAFHDWIYTLNSPNCNKKIKIKGKDSFL